MLEVEGSLYPRGEVSSPLTWRRISHVRISRPLPNRVPAREPISQFTLDRGQAIKLEQFLENAGLVADDVLIPVRDDLWVAVGPPGHRIEMMPTKFEFGQQTFLLRNRLQVSSERDLLATHGCRHDAVSEVPIVGCRRLDADPVLGATPVVEVPGDHKIARISNEAGNPKLTKRLEIETAIVDRGDSVLSKALVEVLEVTVVVPVSTTPRQTPIENRSHDAAEVDRQALVVRAVDEMEVGHGWVDR